MENSASKRSQKLRWIILFVVCLIVAGFVLPLLLNRDTQASDFISKQSARIRQCKTLQDSEQAAHFTRSFSDGTWVAVMSEHACSSGAGFDATVFYDSENIVRFDKLHHFCGLEGLHNELTKISADSLREFYTRLTNCQLAQLP
jgi:hypothetical protein